MEESFKGNLTTVVWKSGYFIFYIVTMSQESLDQKDSSVEWIKFTAEIEQWY